MTDTMFIIHFPLKITVRPRARPSMCGGGSTRGVQVKRKKKNTARKWSGNGHVVSMKNDSADATLSHWFPLISSISCRLRTEFPLTKLTRPAGARYDRKSLAATSCSTCHWKIWSAWSRLDLIYSVDALNWFGVAGHLCKGWGARLIQILHTCLILSHVLIYVKPNDSTDGFNVYFCV